MRMTRRKMGWGGLGLLLSVVCDVSGVGRIRIGTKPTSRHATRATKMIRKRRLVFIGEKLIAQLKYG
jgi:hypothetical protein